MTKSRSLLFSWQSVIVIFLFGIFTSWWLFVQKIEDVNSSEHQLFAAVYGVVALWGGIWGLVAANKWGFLKSLFGRSLVFFSLGLLAQEFGQLTYSYYIYVKHIEVPYPSIGDLGYFGSIFLYLIGLYYLSKVIGIKFTLKTFKKRFIALSIPLIMLALSYVLFLQDYEFDWSNPVRVFLDFGYPFGEAFYISFALVIYALSFRVLGGVMKNKILLLLFALVLQYLADFTFLYKSQLGIWHAGGVNDYMYLSAYVVMSIALLRLSHALDKN